MAIERGQSTIIQSQACSEDAFAAGRLVAMPAAKRSSGFREGVLEVVGCCHFLVV